MSFSLSYYNYFVKDKSKFILYNSLSNKLIVFNENKYAELLKLFNNLAYFKYHHFEVFDLFVKWKFIKTSHLDEIEYVKNKYLNVLEDANLSLTINPTLDCFFKCWYCFVEQNVEKIKGTRMNDNIVEGIIKYITKYVETTNCNNINIQWFGGEPLMFYNKCMKKIIFALDEMQKKHNFSYVNSITTNGYLINQDIISDFEKYNVNQVQITLDGYRERHDSIRYINSKIGSYDKIIKNIKLLANNTKNINIILRINYDLETLDDINSIIKDLDIKNKNKITIDLQRVWQIKPSKKLYENVKKAHEKFQKTGFRVNNWAFKLGKKCNCIYDKKNSFIINYDGKVYKCVARDYKDSIGFLNTDGCLILNNDYNYYKLKKATDINKCVECKELPLCHGPCVQKISESNDIEKLCILKQSDISVTEYIIKRANELLDEQS